MLRIDGASESVDGEGRDEVLGSGGGLGVAWEYVGVVGAREGERKMECEMWGGDYWGGA